MEHITTIYYKKNTDSITILGLEHTPSILELPREIDGLPVVALGDFACAMSLELPMAKAKTKAVLRYKEVDAMPDDLTTGYALEQLFLPDTLRELGVHTFDGCSALTSIVLPAGIVDLPAYAFANCVALSRVGLSENLSDIGEYAFFGCNTLTQLHLPKHIEKIGKYAFYNCRNLQKINIPPQCKSLGMGMFLNCDGLFDIAVEQGNFLSEIVSNLNQALRLTITFDDGMAQVLLPDYQSEYIENTPARMLSQVHYGSGHVYRQCVGKYAVDFRGYDKLFYMAKREDAGVLALQMVLGRLQYPYRLYDEYRQMYLAYLGEHFLFAVEYLLRNQEESVLEDFARWGLYTKENIGKVIEMAQKTGQTGLVAFLLNEQKQFGGKTFEL